MDDLEEGIYSMLEYVSQKYLLYLYSVLVVSLAYTVI
jgi:hypothetical protein